MSRRHQILDRTRLTGAALVLREAGQFSPIAGTVDYYDPYRQIIMLSQPTAYGTDWKALINGAHEVAHARQYERWPKLMGWKWFMPVHLFLEWHACRMAERICKTALTRDEIKQARSLERKTLRNILFGLIN